MPKINQVAALIRAHVTGDEASFSTYCQQIIAHEKSQKRLASAKQIEQALRHQEFRRAIPMRELAVSDPKVSGMFMPLRVDPAGLASLIVASPIHNALAEVVAEHQQSERLGKAGLAPMRKILLDGPPGTGKTMTARCLAFELGLPAYVVASSQVLSSYFGETGKMLDKAFVAIRQTKGLYLFDEFDSLSAGRDNNDRGAGGEMRRAVNWLLRNLEDEIGDSVILAATNLPTIIDRAAFRRFDLRISYSLPDEGTVAHLIRKRLEEGGMVVPDFPEGFAKVLSGISHHDVVSGCERAMKNCIMAKKRNVTLDNIVAAIHSKKPPIRKVAARRKKPIAKAKSKALAVTEVRSGDSGK